MKIYFVSCLLLGMHLASSAQNATDTLLQLARPKVVQAIYAEFGGQSLIFSLNYDRRLSRCPDGWGVRVGISALPSYNSAAITFPVGINYLIGRQHKYFEVGAGTMLGNWQFDSATPKSIFGTLYFGYRYQRLKSSVRIGSTLVFYTDREDYVLLVPVWPGLSLGAAF